jgi:3-hydroxybutyryl-CoA dehydratase
MDAAATEQCELVLGQSVERLFVIDDEQVRAFADVSGDHNPLHLDDAYARKTVFRGRVAHGMLLGAHISAVLGDTLPGPGAIYLSQTLEFEHPVRIPSEVKVHVEVVELGEHRRTTLATTCSVGDQVVARGWAVVIPPKARKARPGE